MKNIPLKPVLLFLVLLGAAALLLGKLLKQPARNVPEGAPPAVSPRQVTYLSPLKGSGEPVVFDRSTTQEWEFALPSRPVLARLEAELNHSGFNCPLRVRVNGQEAGNLSVYLPPLRDGAYQFFQVARPGTADGFSYVADATVWQPAWIFLERPLLQEGVNRIQLSSTLDRLSLRNLRLEILPVLPAAGALDLRPDPEPAPLDTEPLALPPLVTLQDGGWKSFTPPRGIRYTALYFSAQWCGPCRAFTPKLVEWYRQVRSRHPEFELVFVSSDRSEQAMLDYMKEANMPWPAVPFDQVKPSGLRKWSARGIPFLILFGPGGQPATAKNREWRPPQEVLREAEALLGQNSPQEAAK